MPLSAVTFGGHDARQQRIDDGDSRPQVVAQEPTLIWLSVSVNAAAPETSEPVPAVVGTQTTGRIGPGMIVVAEVVAGAPPWASSTAVILARSMLLPPPRPRTSSGPNRLASTVQCATRFRDGSGLAAVEYADLDACLFQRLGHRRQHADAIERRIGDDE